MKKNRKILIAAAVTGILNAGAISVAYADSDANETEVVVAKGGGGGGKGGERGGGGSDVKLGTGENKPVPSAENTCKGATPKKKKQESNPPKNQ